MDQEADAITARTGLAHKPSAEGDYVSSIYRERVMLASRRFAMIDDGLGFQLVPWRPASTSISASISAARWGVAAASIGGSAVTGGLGCGPGSR
ncbi:DUF3363 domain-containing protein [Sphingobium fuliginis]|jgi:hypothetical protein|uniref:DUF3363 domain-containing protein n=1 Tax=Sphingobium fuliginis (strain ATCC 27551) TaxID=336203 RepID=UPI00041805C0|nr:DUF3363 domain-containing protein [Sphingobium fuliginis]